MEKTRYKVVDRQTEYDACRKLMTQEGYPDQELVFPTIIAFQGRKLIGFLATSPNADIVFAGPLVMDTRKIRMWTAMRLVSLYEESLRHLGIVSYVFWVDPDKSGLARGMKEYFPELKPYAIEDGKHFYVRYFTDGKEDEGSGSDGGGTAASKEPGRSSGASA